LRRQAHLLAAKSSGGRALPLNNTCGVAPAQTSATTKKQHAQGKVAKKVPSGTGCMVACDARAAIKDVEGTLGTFRIIG
jgi:hypothetical protein